jgi:hypothetical protein
MRSVGHANYAPHALHAHRLWMKLWTVLGVAEENTSQPASNGVVSRRLPLGSHSQPSAAPGAATAAVYGPAVPAWANWVFPRMHRAYDDYESYY